MDHHKIVWLEVNRSNIKAYISKDWNPVEALTGFYSGYYIPIPTLTRIYILFENNRIRQAELRYHNKELILVNLEERAAFGNYRRIDVSKITHWAHIPEVPVDQAMRDIEEKLENKKLTFEDLSPMEAMKVLIRKIKEIDKRKDRI